MSSTVGPIGYGGEMDPEQGGGSVPRVTGRGHHSIPTYEGAVRSQRSHGDVRYNPSLKDMAAQFIREAIVSGQLAPWTKIEQDEIADELGSSRLPIREALIELTAKGFVVAVPRRGAFVVHLTVQDVEDHFEVVGMLFAVAARRAATRISDDELAGLRRLHGRIAATADDSVCQDLNHDFLRIINEAGSSNRLLLTLRYLWLSLPNDFYTNAPTWAANEAMYREQILAMLEARDARGAAKSAEEHLRACAKVTIDSLRARGYWSGTTPPSGAAAPTRR